MLACGWNAFHRRGGRWAPESDTKRLACGCLQMAMSTKLMMRQGQTLVMTPQLLQAIKLLQFSNMELSAFLHEELERNPLLETQDGDDAPARDGQTAEAFAAEFDAGATENFSGEPQEGDWARDTLAVDAASLSSDLGADMSNAFQPDGPSVTASAPREALEGAGLSATSWNGAGGGGEDGEAPNLEAYVAARPSLHEHLAEQLSLACPDPRRRLIGQSIIDGIDETGYLRESVPDIADRLDANLAETEAVLALVQSFDPSGVGARDLAECLAIQLKERDRYDPAMEIFVANLPLVAKRDFAQLARLCGVDAEDVADMAAELRALDPKPGRAFGDAPIQPLVADVIVRPATDGSWHVELNSDALPRVLVNHSYAAKVSAGARDGDKTFISNCLQNANWLTKSLEQRSRTILKVASEIVRLQDAFLARGVEHLRPAQPSHHRRRHRHARIDGLAGHLQQIHDDAAGHLRTQIFLLRLHRDHQRRRGAFGGIGQVPHQADDRPRGARRCSFGRRNRRQAQGGGYRHCPAHRGQISGQPEDSLLGGPPPREDGAVARGPAGALSERTQAAPEEVPIDFARAPF